MGTASAVPPQTEASPGGPLLSSGSGGRSGDRRCLEGSGDPAGVGAVLDGSGPVAGAGSDPGGRDLDGSDGGD